MQYLKPHKESFLYETAEEGPVVSFEVEYDLGGQSMWTGNTRARGIYIRVSESTLERTERGYIVRSTTLHMGTGTARQNGAYILVEDLPRKNARKLKQAAEYFDSIAPVVASLWDKNDVEQAKQILFAKIALYRGPNARKAA